MPDENANEKTFSAITTLLGRAKIASAIANGVTLNLSQIAIGDGAGLATTHTESDVALVREVWRGALNTLAPDPQNPAYVIAEAVVPSEVGGWTVREAALLDNAGAVVAIADVAPTYKPLAAQGSVRQMVFRFYVDVEQQQNVQLVIDPNVVLATRQYVDDRTSLAALLPGGTAGMVLSKASNQDGDVEWTDLGDGLSVLVNAVEERQDLAGGQTVIALNTLTTGGLAVYIDGIRIAKDAGWTATDTTHVTLSSPASSGQKFLGVQNEPAAALTFLQKEANLGDLPNIAVARENLGISNAQLLLALGPLIMRVGYVFHTTEAVNPATYYGFGVWELYAQGRTIIGFNAADSDFNSVGKTGGAKTHMLTVAQLPAHTHGTKAAAVATGEAGAHTHQIHGEITRDDSSTGSDYWEYSCGSKSAVPNADVAIPGSLTTNGAHSHTVNIPAGSTESTGGGQSIGHLPPYIVTYTWRRTA